MPSTATPSSTPLTLEQVKEQFSSWRGTRAKIGRIPYLLWEAVRHLVKEQGYTPRQVAAELGLNYQQLRLKLEDKDKQNKTSSTAPDFIQVSLPPVSSSCPQPPSLGQKIFFPRAGSLALIRSDGTILKVSGLDHKDLCSFVQSFLKR
jgi:hypothetical protein